jgi:hypothetical protein
VERYPGELEKRGWTHKASDHRFRSSQGGV